VEADAVNRRDTDGAGNNVLDLLQFAMQRIVSLDNLLAIVVEHLAFAGEPEFLLAPFDEERLKLPFSELIC